MSDYFSMGTTPSFYLTLKDSEGNDLDFNLINLSSFVVYFKQENGLSVISKSGENIQVNMGLSQIVVPLTQEDTFLFQKNNVVEIEVRWLFNEYLDGVNHKAGKTKIYKLNLGSVLKEEVIE